MTEIELKTLEKSQTDLIVEFEGDEEELKYFSESIQTIGLNLSELYIAALYNNKFMFADIIIQSGKYNIKKDKKLNTEFFNWGYSDRDDCMIRCLEDGFQPNVWKTMKIMDLLIVIRNNPSNNIVYGKLFLILRAYKIKKLIRRIHSKKTLD